MKILYKDDTKRFATPSTYKELINVSGEAMKILSGKLKFFYKDP